MIKMSVNCEVNNMLEKIVSTYAVKTLNPEPGDIILFTLLHEPQHLGILDENNTVIHAYEPRGKVIKHHLDTKWKNRINSY